MTTSLDPDAMPSWLARLGDRTRTRNVIAGINDDDCAVFRWSNKLLVVTTDHLNARPIALELGLGSYRTLGRLLVGANMSDLCGSGAKPEAMLVGITMPRDASREDFQVLMLGVRQECSAFKVPLIGGDTKLGKSMSLLGVAIGSAASRRNLFLKNGARAGDIIWVSGPVGSCSAAIVGIKEDFGNKAWKKWAKNAITAPSVPLLASRQLSRARVANGGIDISDGLGNDLSRLCEASNVGVIIDSARIPIAPEVAYLASAKQLPGWAFSFASGGDFQFLATTNISARTSMQRMGFSEIGRTAPNRELRVRTPLGKTVALPVGGHRDRGFKSFYHEVKSLVRGTKYAW